jgi:hypothetical protein
MVDIELPSLSWNEHAPESERVIDLFVHTMLCDNAQS